MSWEAAAHVLKLGETTTKDQLTPVDMLVLYALAARHHRDARCAFGQLKRMAMDTHLNVDTIVESINRLEEHGVVRIYFGTIPLKTRGASSDRRTMRGNLYCFIGLDPDDGPNLDDFEPRRRAGGRPPRVETDQFGQAELVAQGDEFGPSGGSVRSERVDGSGPEPRSVRSEQADEFGLSGDRLTGTLKPVSNRLLEPIETGPPGPPQGENGAVRSAEPADSLESIAHGPPLRDGHCSLCGNVIDTRGQGHRNWPAKARCEAHGLTLDQVDEAIAAARAAEPPADHHEGDTGRDES